MENELSTKCSGGQELISPEKNINKRLYNIQGNLLAFRGSAAEKLQMESLST